MGKLRRNKNGKIFVFERKNKSSDHVMFKLNEKCISWHRLVALHFIENPEKKPFVCHKNSIPYDNRADNLYWGTPTENLMDFLRLGKLVKKRIKNLLILEFMDLKKTCINGNLSMVRNLKIKGMSFYEIEQKTGIPEFFVRLIVSKNSLRDLPLDGRHTCRYHEIQHEKISKKIV